MSQRPGNDPTRRNRNQGTAKRGHGTDNRNVVPDRWSDPRTLLEQINDFVLVTRKIRGIDVPFLVEKTLPGCAHASTVDDIARVLLHVPSDHLFGDEHTTGVSGIVLRQPTRKERVLAGVWGRLLYHGEIGPIDGTIVYLDATDIPCEIRWSRRLDREQKEELARLREEADEFDEDKRYFRMRFGLDAVRRVQLYRTLLHEIGHMVHFQEFVDRAEARAAREEGRAFDLDRRDDLVDRYHSQPAADREAFAHNYAERWSVELRSQDVIPFERILDVPGMRRDGLDPMDFGRA